MTNNKKIYLSITTFAIISILLTVFVIYPLFRGIKENSQALWLIRSKLVSLTTQGEQRKKMEDLYRLYQLDLESMENVFIDPDVPLALIGFLEGAASSSQVHLEISSLTKTGGKQEPWPSLLIQLSSTGLFPDFLELLEKVESGPFLIDVLDLTLRRPTQRDVRPEEIPLADTIATLSIKVYTK